MLIILWARFRRWCHRLRHPFQRHLHYPADVYDGYEDRGGELKRIECDCGQVFWNRLPRNWWQYHHRNCGTKFRGCDPQLCPKDIYERTGVWRTDLANDLGED